jgi:cell division protein FtsB
MSKAHLGFQVREKNPWRLWLGIALSLLLLVIMFLLGRAYQSYELSQLKLVEEAMVARISELEQRNESLVKKNAHLGGISKIEHDAYEKSNQSLVKLQRDLLELKEELVFYQGIVSPEELALGVNIQSFELTRKNNNGLYAYKLVLTKRGKSNQVIKGSMDFRVKGTQQGESKALTLENIKQEFDRKDEKFSFRYFQVFEGELLLPDSFEPSDIELEIKPTTRKIKNFTESITWVQALTGGDN